MPKLLIWTTADADAIRKTIGAALKNFRPDIPEHQIVPFVAGETLEGNEGDVIIGCGAKVLNQMQIGKIVPKNRTIGSMREKPLRMEGSPATYFVTYDPNTVNSEPGNREIIDWDTRLAVRYLRTGSMRPQIGNYRWVNTFQPLIDWVNAEYEKTKKPVPVSTDLETEGFYPWYPDKDIVSISFTGPRRTADVLYTGRQKAPIPLREDVVLWDQIHWLLTSPKIALRLANGKFDMNWIIEKWGIDCTNFKFDSLLVGSLLNENRSNSLELHAKIFTDMGGYDKEFNDLKVKDRMGEIQADDGYLTYAGGDTDACQQSSDILKEQLLEDGELTKLYVRIIHPAARAFEKLERRGIHIDREKYDKLGEDLAVKISEYEKTLLGLLPNKMRVKHRDKIEAQIAQGKSPITTALVGEFFFTPNGLNLKPLMKTPTGKISTAKAHLMMFKDDPAASEFISTMRDHSSASKTKSTFVDGFLNSVRPDGLLHPTYMLFHGAFDDDEDNESGSTTGRLSAKNPAFQTLPSKTVWTSRLRECFIAPPGKVILGIDYSQGELKIVACRAPEPTMLAAYENGLDLHAVTGAKLATVELEEFLSWKKLEEDHELYQRYDLMRARAKPANFGLLYGMGAAGFQAYAWATYGLALTLQEAEVMREAFFELYPRLLNYHDEMRAFVKLHEFVRSPLGRVRNLPTIRAWDREIRAKAERQAINSPIQSTLTDMMIWAIAEIEAAYGDEIAAFGVIHDATYFYVDEDKVELRAKQAGEIMSNLPFHEFGWVPQLKFTVDAKAGANLANIKGIKLAA